MNPYLLKTTEFPTQIAEPSQVIVIDPVRQEQPRLRVAAYARVSSDSEDQRNSFAAQLNHYHSLFESHESWQLVDIYADEGLTATRMDIREDFNRLLTDCRKGKIDRIFVKSVSRFCRNTKESLITLRELSALGVSVYFEKENIDTAKSKDELLLALHSCFAQEESGSISGNMRKGAQMRMKNGTYVSSSVPYGYILQDNKLIINDKQAQVVREIFTDYLGGSNMKEIADKLTANGILKKDGASKWRHTAISYVLSNERYMGDCLWQKSYMTTTLPHRKKRNNGELDRYYVSEMHPPIIDRKTFMAVQELKQRRGARIPKRHMAEDFLRKKVYCGECDTLCRQKTVSDISYRICTCHDHDPTACAITQLPDEEITAAFRRMCFKLRSNMSIMQSVHAGLEAVYRDRHPADGQLQELNIKIANLTEQNHVLADLQAKGIVDSALSISQSNVLMGKISALRLEKSRLLEQNQPDDALRQTRLLLELLDSSTEQTELFAQIVDRVLIEQQDNVRFRLKNGVELMESVQRRTRR